MKNFLKKYFYVLGDSKNLIFFMVVFFLISAVIDFLGISLIAPFISVMLNPEKIGSYGVATNVLSFLSTSYSVQALGGVILLCFTVRSMIGYAIQSKILKFSYIVQAKLICKLLKSYQKLPYSYHLDKNSSSLIHNITNLTKIYTNDLLIPSLKIVSDGFIIVFIMSLVMYISPVATGLMFATSLLGFFPYYFLFKSKVREIGKQSNIANENLIKKVSESVHGLKDIRILNKEKFFYSAVENNAYIHANSVGKYMATTTMPKFLMEGILVVFVISFTIVGISLDYSSEYLFAILATLAAAGIRILPSLVQLSSSFTALSYSTHTLDTLYQDLKLANNILYKSNSDSITSNETSFNQVDLKDLSFSYGSLKNALSNINFTIKKGQSIGIIGTSGSGKTTLVNIIINLLDREDGDIFIDGTSIEEYGWNNWLSLVSYIPQQVFLLDGTILENVAFGESRDKVDEKLVWDAIRNAQLEDFVAKMPLSLNTLVGESGVKLSGGQRQRIALARAFYNNRKVIIMDEATSALDSETEAQVMESINCLKGKVTLIVIAHRLTTVRECDSIIRLESGKIVEQGSYNSVVQEKSNVYNQ